MASPPVLDSRTRRRALIAAIGCTVSSILGLAISLPLLSIIMERDMGVSGAAIGLNTAMAFISAIIFMPFLPRLMARYPQTVIMAVCVFISSGSMLLYGLFQDYYFWLFIRAFNGAALAILFAIGEIWINQFAEDKYRGRLLAFYAVALGVSFGVGPIILQWLGTIGIFPFILSSAIMTLASLPLLAARGVPQFFSDEEGETPDFFGWFWRAPVVVLPALVCGAQEVASEGLTPVYALRAGYDAAGAALMLSIFAAGIVASGVVVGWLADFVNRMRLMLVLCVIWLLLLGLVPFSQMYFTPFAALIFMLGFCSTGVYLVGMCLAGQRYQGAALASVGAALVFGYQVGGLIAPPISGWVMDNALPNNNPDGLLILLCLMGIPVLLAVLGRTERVHLFTPEPPPESNMRAAAD